MSVTYAGIPLNSCSPETAARIAERIPLSEVLEFQTSAWPGQVRTNWPAPGFVPQRGVQVNSLYWPSGARRYAIAHFCCSDSRLKQISQKVYQSGSYGNQPYGPQDLVIKENQRQAGPLNTPNDKEINSITAKMFLISARPLFQFINTPGQPYWLLTLCDDRYWWWFRDTGSIHVTEGTTKWDDLFTQLGTQLGVTIAFDPVSPNYSTPTAQFSAQFENSAIMLDAVAYHVGQRVSRGLDGNVKSRSPVNAAEDLDINLDALDPITQDAHGGGFFRYTAGQSQQDFPGILPKQIRAVFPKQNTTDFYPITVTLTSLSLSDLAGVVTNNETKTFHFTNQYDGTSATTATLTNIANQFATDWYRFQVSSVDFRMSGIVDWNPSGFEDYVEWHHGGGDNNVWTRVQRGPLNDLTDTINTQVTITIVTNVCPIYGASGSS